MISQLGQLLGASSLHHQHQVWNGGGPLHLYLFRNSPCNWQPRNDTLKGWQGQRFTLPGRTDSVIIFMVCCHLKEESQDDSNDHSSTQFQVSVTTSLLSSVFLSFNQQAVQIRFLTGSDLGCATSWLHDLGSHLTAQCLSSLICQRR